MSKVGFIVIGHANYQNDIGLEMADKGIAGLKSRGIEVIFRGEAATDPMMAGEIARELLKQEVESVIVFLGTWIECSTAMGAIREIEHLPFVIWGFPMFRNKGMMDSTGSYVSFAVLKGALTRMEYNFKSVMGAVDDDEAYDKIEAFVKAAHCCQSLKRTRVGLVGYAAMSMYTGTFDHMLMRKRIGPEIVQMDTYSLIRLAETISDEECREAAGYLGNVASISDDVKNKDVFTALKLYIALKRICENKKLHAINVKCQYELSQEYGMIACVPISLLAEDGVVTSCEGDIINTVTMVMLNYLTGQVIYYGDVLNHNGNVVKLSSCGFVPYSLGREAKKEVINFMPGFGFRGIHNSFTLKPGRVTYMRLAENVGDYYIYYGTGTGLETELRQGCMPALDIKLDGDIDKLVGLYASQHLAMCYGDISEEIEDMAGILGIKAIRI